MMDLGCFSLTISAISEDLDPTASLVVLFEVTYSAKAVILLLRNLNWLISICFTGVDFMEGSQNLMNPSLPAVINPLFPFLVRIVVTGP